MSTRTLKWIAVVLPVLFMVGVLYARLNFAGGDPLQADLYAILAVALGAISFSILVFAVIERREAETKQSNLNLEALHQAALALTNEVDLQQVLQQVVNISRELLHAKYGALGVADLETARITQFITAGITEEERLRIGAPPQGHGLLGVLNPGGRSLIINDIRKDPRSIGFPPNHPPMQSLLGVPIIFSGKVFGNLYVADRYVLDPTGIERLLNFDEEDCHLLEKFATQAAIAIRNAQLYRKNQELVVLQERERFGMALHDGIMQQVYATGLSLQDAALKLPAGADGRPKVEAAIQSLSQVLRDMRNYIMGLRTGRYQGQNLALSLSQMARELHANTLMDVDFAEPTAPLGLSEQQTDELVLITQEALANIRKHAHARRVHLAVQRVGDRVLLTVQDDGVGFDPAAPTDGNGLRNMQDRARALNADLTLASKPGHGTQLSFSVPVQLAA